jgi:uncharacterized protein
MAQTDGSAQGMAHMLTTLAAALGLGYAALVLLVFVFQARLVYFPEMGRNVPATPLAIGLPFEEVWLDAAPDVRLHGWFVPRSDARGVALIFHGNAGSIGLRLDWLRMFHDLGYASLIVDYRGYGRSTGAPSEQGTYDDASAAWDHLIRARGWNPGDIVIVGESLGGSIAAQLAARTSPRALVIQSGFTSVPDLAGQIYWFLPVRLISRFSYDTLSHVRSVTVPILIAHSREDEIVPFTHGRALFEQASEPKTFVELRGGHNEGFLFVRREWVDALGAFLRKSEP